MMTLVALVFAAAFRQLSPVSQAVTNGFTQATDVSLTVDILRKRLAKGFDKPFFLGGDINSEPESSIMSELKKDFVVLTSTDEPTYIGRTQSCIDYILLDKAHAGAYRSESWVLGDCSIDAPSDHRPVALSVRPAQ